MAERRLPPYHLTTLPPPPYQVPPNPLYIYPTSPDRSCPVLSCLDSGVSRARWFPRTCHLHVLPVEYDTLPLLVDAAGPLLAHRYSKPTPSPDSTSLFLLTILTTTVNTELFHLPLTTDHPPFPLLSISLSAHIALVLDHVCWRD